MTRISIELTPAELRAAVRALDIAITVSQRGPDRITLGKPLRGRDGTETAAAKRVFKRLLEQLPPPESP